MRGRWKKAGGLAAHTCRSEIERIIECLKCRLPPKCCIKIFVTQGGSRHEMKIQKY